MGSWDITRTVQCWRAAPRPMPQDVLTAADPDPLRSKLGDAGASWEVTGR